MLNSGPRPIQSLPFGLAKGRNKNIGFTVHNDQNGAQMEAKGHQNPAQILFLEIPKPSFFISLFLYVCCWFGEDLEP